jgi:CheY-like chemotaxis protein
MDHSDTMVFSPNSNPTPLILLVEGEEDHAIVFQEAFSEAGLNAQLQVLGNGKELVKYLKRESEYEDMAHPDLIFLGLDLPHKEGLDVLSNIKACRSSRRIPIIVLANCDDHDEIDRCYELGANSVIMEPFNFEQFIQIIKKSMDFWFGTVKMPTR